MWYSEANLFPKSIHKYCIWSALHQLQGNMDEWWSDRSSCFMDEVKDSSSGLALSGGQQ